MNGSDPRKHDVAKLCVMGLGYIGLPTAVMFAGHGLHVHGVDINPSVIEKLQKGQLSISEPGLEERFKQVTAAGRLTVSTVPEHADAYILAVPTPNHSDKTANLEHVKNAAAMIVPYLLPGNLVLLESTVPPGTTENVLAPILGKTGLRIGEELFIAHSPERVYPGKLLEELVNNQRVVGGLNRRSAELAADLYRCFVKGDIYITDVVTAEMVKLIENAYRDVNIAFANELARIAEKIGFNVWEAIRLANSHPRVNIHSPGPGVGGHCIAVDPWFIIEKAPMHSLLLKAARIVNDKTPFCIVQKIEELVADVEEPVITLLGLSYKENVDDLRESPALVINEELQRKGYQVKTFDPLVQGNFPQQINTLHEAAEGSDCLVVLTGHDSFKKTDYRQVKPLMRNHLILDTRHCLSADEIVRLGFTYHTIGAPSFPRRDPNA